MPATFVTTPRGLVQLFARALGVQPRLSRKVVRSLRRANKHAQYRAAERRAIAVAKGAGPIWANGLLDKAE